MDNLTKVENQYRIEEDEIDLKELFNTIWINKIKIILFSSIVIFFTLIYLLSIPNSYNSSVILSPQGDDKKISGGFSSLASLAGVNLGGSSSKDPFIMMETVLKDYSFNEYMVKKYNLVDKLENQGNLVFAFGFDLIYSLTHSDEKGEDERTEDEKIFNTIKILTDVFSISKEKESGIINLSVTLNDRFMAKELLDIYLEEMINKIKSQDMKEIEKQIEYYKKELNSTYDVSLKEQLSKSLSALMQKRVFSQANDYYFVTKLVDSRVAYIKEKTKPKRALILVVSAITSLILGIFIIFFIEFIKGNRSENKV